jgi:hypothetical protein
MAQSSSKQLKQSIKEMTTLNYKNILRTLICFGFLSKAFILCVSAGERDDPPLPERAIKPKSVRFIEPPLKEPWTEEQIRDYYFRTLTYFTVGMDNSISQRKSVFEHLTRDSEGFEKIYESLAAALKKSFLDHYVRYYNERGSCYARFSELMVHSGITIFSLALCLELATKGFKDFDPRTFNAGCGRGMLNTLELFAVIFIAYEAYCIACDRIFTEERKSRLSSIAEDDAKLSALIAVCLSAKLINELTDTPKDDLVNQLREQITRIMHESRPPINKVALLMVNRFKAP